MSMSAIEEHDPELYAKLVAGEKIRAQKGDSLFRCRAIWYHEWDKHHTFNHKHWQCRTLFAVLAQALNEMDPDACTSLELQFMGACIEKRQEPLSFSIRDGFIDWWRDSSPDDMRIFTPDESRRFRQATKDLKAAMAEIENSMTEPAKAEPFRGVSLKPLPRGSTVFSETLSRPAFPDETVRSAAFTQLRDTVESDVADEDSDEESELGDEEIVEMGDQIVENMTGAQRMWKNVQDQLVQAANEYKDGRGDAAKVQRLFWACKTSWDEVMLDKVSEDLKRVQSLRLEKDDEMEE